MNSLAPRQLERETRREMSEIDQQKLIEGQLQLEDEDEARKRRVKLRKQRQVKLAALRKAKRRARAFKLAGFWLALITGGFFAMVWYAEDVLALMR